MQLLQEENQEEFNNSRLLPNGRPVARGAQGKSMGDQISVQGARAGAWLNTRH